jgi:uncharacterized protein YbjQ (UPF0145 family)
MPEVPLYTFNFFDPTKEVALGSVFAKNAQAISLGRAVVAGVKGLFGGKASELEKKVADAKEGAKSDLYAQLSKEYPSATSVIGVQYQIIEMGGFIIATIVGTPVARKSSGGVKKTLKLKRR